MIDRLAYERDGHILEVELVRAVHLADALREDERAEALALGEVAALVVVAHLFEETHKQTRITGEMWEKWGATYGRNGWVGEKHKKTKSRR